MADLVLQDEGPCLVEAVEMIEYLTMKVALLLESEKLVTKPTVGFASRIGHELHEGVANVEMDGGH